MKFGWMNYIFNTPELHRWHHSTDLSEGDKNFGENLMLWDLVFRSFYLDPTRHRPAIIGIKSAMPKTFFAQIAMPFRWHRYQDKYKAGEVDKSTLM
jgi:sterol desaturase/sphingolipid hydroxylase (fatty acid hydroxylase superfamily)